MAAVAASFFLSRIIMFLSSFDPRSDNKAAFVLGSSQKAVMDEAGFRITSMFQSALETECRKRKSSSGTFGGTMHMYFDRMPCVQSHKA